MIKLVVFFLILLALAFSFAHIADLPGHVLLQWGETEIRVSLVTALAALLALLVALGAVWTLIGAIFRLPGFLSLSSRMRRRARGQHALARGLVAVGVGDTRMAKRYADESERLLGKEPLTLLLKAQAAQLGGDGKGAEHAFKAMLDDGDTQNLGLRGLYVEAERRGDRDAARLFAEEAYRRAPETPWAGESLLGFRATARDWRGAIGIVDQSVSRRLMDRAEGRKKRAILLAAAAQESLAANPDEALTLALEALRIAPELVPAAELAARRLSARGELGKATRILETAWKANPHPDLAAAYLGARIGDSALDRLKRARALLKLTPTAREARFAIARAAIDAREFEAAREALEALALEKPTVRTCLLMAELEELESSNMGLVRAWLARAAGAPRDPVWMADGVISDHWAPCGPMSGRIGAFEWREPPQTAEAGLRARIDANRFDVHEVIDAEAPPALEGAPQTGAADAAGLVPASLPAQAPETIARAQAPVQPPIIPDDPGPDTEGTGKARGFRFFG